MAIVDEVFDEEKKDYSGLILIVCPKWVVSETRRIECCFKVRVRVRLGLVSTLTLK